MRPPEVLAALGIDGAVAYALLARSVNIVGSAGTVLLIVSFLTPISAGCLRDGILVRRPAVGGP